MPLINSNVCVCKMNLTQYNYHLNNGKSGIIQAADDDAAMHILKSKFGDSLTGISLITTRTCDISHRAIFNAWAH